jgi:hypothetical protein
MADDLLDHAMQALLEQWLIEHTKDEISDLLRNHSSREVQQILAERDARQKS